MDSNVTWTWIRDLLGRDPTRIEEELAIHLIRTGHFYTVEEVILGKRPSTCPIGAIRPVADLVLETWNSMERIHQDALRSQLQPFSGGFEVGRCPGAGMCDTLLNVHNGRRAVTALDTSNLLDVSWIP